MYAIVDIETTGGSAQKDKITEIAIYKHNGKAVVDEYSTLVNPERNIPYYITQLTGISNEMVADAPCFYEVAKDIVEFTKDCIFVAHNVAFDYRFVKNEFAQLGFHYQKDTLCTVKLSRKLLPGHTSYSLGNLCSDLNIAINGRHRAGGDAYATALLFSILVQQNNGILPKSESDLIDPKILNPSLNFELVKNLPEACGVYYLYNQNNDLIYIGKSKNIRGRVLTHLNNGNTAKSGKMASEIANIDFELTGSELIALLKESHEIKQSKPLYNRAQRRTLMRYGLFLFEDTNGYLNLSIEKTDQKIKKEPLTTFSSLEEGKNRLNRWIKKYQLCQKLCGMYETQGACFNYQVHECHGACIGQEFAYSYNLRVEELLKILKYDSPNMAILGEGRNPEEKSVVWVENGTYLGFGFFDETTQFSQLSDLKDVINTYPDNRDIQQIINSYLRKHKKLQVEKF
ncbi:exonuclease domain-containing protein [Saccharicrinis sp. FJH2]|uniref:exonuclease domain-containing protein n=1 Tax=Saccharicrinis sp. FJH65 TaxID=3344659 RepID=UPI0035F46E68